MNDEVNVEFKVGKVSYNFRIKYSGVHTLTAEAPGKKVFEYTAFVWQDIVEQMEENFSKETCEEVGKIISEY